MSLGNARDLCNQLRHSARQHRNSKNDSASIISKQVGWKLPYRFKKLVSFSPVKNNKMYPFGFVRETHQIRFVPQTNSGISRDSYHDAPETFGRTETELLLRDWAHNFHHSRLQL